MRVFFHDSKAGFPENNRGGQKMQKLVSEEWQENDQLTALGDGNRVSS